MQIRKQLGSPNDIDSQISYICIYIHTLYIHIYVYTMYLCMYGWMDGWMDVCMHACMSVCLSVRPDGWMDGWMDVIMCMYIIYIYNVICVCTLCFFHLLI